MTAPDWPGLYKWAARYSDGTGASSYDRLSESDKQWLTAALNEGVVDNVDRMRAIKAFLDSTTDDSKALAQKCELLEELTEIVENIDFARDLHKIGGLQTLLALLSSPHAALRWRAAEVVGMAVQSNEPVQKWFLDGHVMQPVLAMLHDTDSTCRTKALLALSCLVRHSAPALSAFHAADGMWELTHLVQDNAPANSTGEFQPSPSAPDQQADVRQLRKALQLLTYIAQEDPRQTSAILKESGLLQCLRGCLSSEDQDVRQWALSLLDASAHSQFGLRQLQVEGGLADQLQMRARQLSAMDVEDLSSFQEELALVERLQKTLKDASIPEQGMAHERAHQQSSNQASALQLAAI